MRLVQPKRQSALYSTVQHTAGYRQPEERVCERGSARATVWTEMQHQRTRKQKGWKIQTSPMTGRRFKTKKAGHGQDNEKQKRAENLNTIGEMIQRAKKERADKRHCGNEMKQKTATTLV